MQTHVQVAIERMRAAGLSIQARDGLIAVRPRHRLTEPQRQWIRVHKAELLSALAPTPELTGEDSNAIHEAIEERAAIHEYDGL